MNLIKATDFNLSQFNEYRLNRITKDQYLFNTYGYSKFLKEQIKIHMFVPIDKEGRFLTLDSNYFGVPEVDLGRYMEAVQNMFFRDFKVTDIHNSTIALLYNNLALHYDFSKGNFLNNDKCIEDLIMFDLELTKKAEKEIFNN